MGIDKAFVEIDGVAMVSRVASALGAAGATDVVCVGGDGPALARLGLRAVVDEWPGEGPLGGLVTALGWSDAATVVVAGCDQPWLDGPSIAALVDAHGGSAAPATVYRVDGRTQPLPGVYDRALRSRLVAALTSGKRALDDALRIARPTTLDATAPGVLRDVDRPEDLRPP